jgi:peptidyl-prolyl cis-trans isomerase D
MEAAALGLVVSKGEIERAVLDSSGFRDSNGRFDRKGFEEYVAYEYGNQRNFVTDQRMNMLAGKMARLVEENSGVSEAEARTTLLQRLEEAQVAFVVLDSRAEADADAITEEQVAAFLAASEEEARTLYHQRAAVYDVPEQVRARHILLETPADADAATVAATEVRARALLARLTAGEDFAEIAQQESDDTGSKASGGDLGFFGRGQMVKPFEEAAFSLEPGTLSDLVRSDFGFHIILVEEHTQASNTPFEDVRDELARELVARTAKSSANEALAEKLSAAVRGGQSLEDAARAEGLTLERSGWLRRRPDGFVPGLGAAQDLMATAFSMKPGESSDRIFTVAGKLALVQLLDRKIAEDVDIEMGIEATRDELRNQKRNQLAQSWIQTRQQELATAGELAVDLNRIGGGR